MCVGWTGQNLGNYHINARKQNLLQERVQLREYAHILNLTLTLHSQPANPGRSSTSPQAEHGANIRKTHGEEPVNDFDRE